MEEFRLKDFHATYLKHGGTLDKKAFKSVIQTFLRLSMDDIVQGGSLHIGYHVGKLQVYRIKRSFRRPIVDWGETRKYKQQLIDEGKPLFDKETGEGNKWLVYNTDEYYYGLVWKKESIREIGYRGTLRNYQFYKLKTFFKTKTKISQAIDEMAPVIFELNGI